MAIPKSRRIKARKFVVPELDMVEFRILYETLLEAFELKHAHAARALAISVKTWRAWDKDPPVWPYWNMVLFHVLKARMAGMAIHRKGFTQSQHAYFRDQLSKLKKGQEIIEFIEQEATQVNGAEDHLRRLLAEKGMFWHKIKLTRWAGGYTPRRLQQAAKKIGIVQESSGFGKDKVSFWRLPTVEHDVDTSQ